MDTLSLLLFPYLIESWSCYPTGTFTVASRGHPVTGVLELLASLDDWTQAIDGLTALSLSLCSDSHSHCDRYIIIITTTVF